MKFPPVCGWWSNLVAARLQISKTNILRPSPSKRLLASPRDSWWMSRSFHCYPQSRKTTGSATERRVCNENLFCVLVNVSVLSRFLLLLIADNYYFWFLSHIVNDSVSEKVNNYCWQIWQIFEIITTFYQHLPYRQPDLQWVSSKTQKYIFTRNLIVFGFHLNNFSLE